MRGVWYLHFKRCFFALFALFTLSNAAHANDNFPPSTILTGSSGTVIGTTVGATGQVGENITYGGGNLNTIWYSWTAPANGVFTAATCNLGVETATNVDTTLIAYTGVAFPLTVVSTNDDATGCNITGTADRASVVTFNATIGTTYRLQVDGWQSNTGTYILRYGLVGLTTNVTDNSTTEGGDTAAFTVVLNAPPAAAPPGGNNMAAQSATVTIGTSPQCTFAPSTLTFTSTNWNVPQTVTVTAIDDPVIEGPHFCSPTSITAANGAYAGVTVTPPTLVVIDNEIATPILSIVKTGVFLAPGDDINGNGKADRNDKITYSFTVTNTGNVPITNVSINDSFSGAGTPPSSNGEIITGDVVPAGDSIDVTANNSVWSILAPGDTVRFRGTYIVTQGDMDNG
jgi:uncharacterized repeat protein (TIGR01451 family)